jgi:hypothetical protein
VSDERDADNCCSDNAQLSGDTYPRNGTEYDDYYEWVAMDDAVVNEAVA